MFTEWVFGLLQNNCKKQLIEQHFYISKIHFNKMYSNNL